MDEMRQHEESPKSTVCILVDATEENGQPAGRTNYWRHLPPEILDPSKVQVYSLRDLRRQNIVFNFDEFETVILNTDLANGDGVFGADESYRYFYHQGPIRMDAWFRNGKHPRLLVEHQGLRLVPSQRAYDAIVGPGEVHALSVEPWFTALAGTECIVIDRFADHPVVRRLGHRGDVTSEKRALEVPPFFGTPAPRWLGAEEGPQVGSVFESASEALYGGWFDEWDSEWIPLLRATSSLAPKNNATLLVKVIQEDHFNRSDIESVYMRKGVIFLSTMRLSARAPKDLISGLLDSRYEEIVLYHRRIMKRRRQITYAAWFLLLLSFVLTSSLLVVAWDLLIVDSQDRMARLLADVVGLPLFVNLVLHWKAARNFLQRGLFAGPSRGRMYYWLRCLVGLEGRELAAARGAYDRA